MSGHFSQEKLGIREISERPQSKGQNVLKNLGKDQLLWQMQAIAAISIHRDHDDTVKSN